MRLATHITRTISSNMVALGLAFVNSVLLTRLLGPEGRGEFAIFTTAAALATLLLTLGSEFAINYSVARGQSRLETILLACLGHALVAAVVMLGLVVANDHVLGSAAFLPASKQRLPFEILAAVLVFGTVLHADVRAALLGRQAFSILNGATITFALLPTVLYGGLLVYRARGVLSPSPGALMAVHTGIAFFSGIGLLAFSIVRYGLRPVFEWPGAARLRAVARDGLSAYVANVLQFLNYRVDYWLVEHFCGMRQLGFYSLASNLTQTTWIVPRSAATVFFPVLAAGERQAGARQALVVRVLLGVFALLASVGAILSRPVLGSIYGPVFVDAAPALIVLLPGSVVYVGSIILASGLAAHGLQPVNTRASFWGFVVTVVADFALIPRYGIVGAALASSLSYVVTTSYVAWKYSKAYSVPLADIFIPRRGDITTALAALKPARGGKA